VVDVWSTLGLPFAEAKVIPLRPRRAEVEGQCTYVEMKNAAE
jgi:5-aminolevulinate synthase